MTLAGSLIALFPVAIVGGAGACAVWMAFAPGAWPALALLAVLYLAPVAAFRVHQALWPMKIGASSLATPGYVPWWGAHQIQLVYIAIPQIEAVLRMVPGLYSAWLRLWGARVGRRVHWTPLVEITDRSLLDVGDGVVFGHRAALYAHVIRPMKSGMLLYVKPIRLESGVFVGGYSILGPGVRVVEGTTLEGKTHGHTNEVLS